MGFGSKFKKAVKKLGKAVEKGTVGSVKSLARGGKALLKGDIKGAGRGLEGSLRKSLHGQAVKQVGRSFGGGGKSRREKITEKLKQGSVVKPVDSVKPGRIDKLPITGTKVPKFKPKGSPKQAASKLVQKVESKVKRTKLGI